MPPPPEPNNRKRVLVLQSRDYRDAPASGRRRIFENYYKCLNEVADPDYVTVESPLNSNSLMPWLAFSLRALLSLGSGSRSLQTLLFASYGNKHLVRRRIVKERYDCILVDSVRLVPLVEGLHYEGTLLLDIDDLLSVRYQGYLGLTERFEFGIFGEKLNILNRFMPRSVLRHFLKREVRLLQNEELRCKDIFRKIIFTSPGEMDHYAERIGPCVVALRSQVIPFRQHATCETPSFTDSTVVFGFIGSDKVIQNRKTIQYLLDLWRRRRITHRLRIAGKMSRTYPNVPENVEFVGFVSSLEAFYGGVHVILSPSFVRGGVKTKVAEAFAYNRLVLGNGITFDGVPVRQDYPLRFEDEELEDFLGNDAATISEEVRGAEEEIRYVLERSSYARYRSFVIELVCVDSRS